MGSSIVFLLVVFIALGSLFFMLAYGALFLAAFSTGKKFSLICLVLLAFSSVGFVIANYPWYYCLPLWIIPPIYAQFKLPSSRSKNLAVKGFWLGIILLVLGTGPFIYFVLPQVDMVATEKKMEQKKAEKLKKEEDRFEAIRPNPVPNPVPDSVPNTSPNKAPNQ